MEVLAPEVAGHGHAQGARNRRAGVSHVKGVVRALVAHRKAGDAPVLPDGRETVAPPGEDLVSVSLVAYVPHDLVARRVEGVMQRQRQLDGAQARGQVAPHLGDHGDEIVSQFFSDDGEIAARHLLEVSRRIDVQQILVIHQDLLASRKCAIS